MAENDAPLWTPDQPERRAPRPSRSWLRVGFSLGIGLLLAYALGQAIVRTAQVLTLILLAFFVAVSLEPIVGWMTRVRLRRGLAVAVVVLIVLAIVAAFVALVVPPVSTEINALIKAVPTWLQELHDHHSSLGRFEDRYHVVEKVKAQLTSANIGSRLASGALGAGKFLLGLLAGTFIVASLTIYFMIGLPTVKGYGIRFAAAGRRQRVADLTDRILSQVGRYMLGNVATSVLAGLATFVWADVTGIPYPSLLGFFVAIMDLIPVIGSTIGGAAVTLAALAVSWPVAIATGVFYTLFRFAEDHLVTPLTMKYVVRVHPVATTVAVLLGGVLLGIVGALVAVPVATAIGLIVDEVVFPERDQAPR